MRTDDAEVGRPRESGRVTGGSAPVGRTGRRAAQYPARCPSLLGGPCAYRDRRGRRRSVRTSGALHSGDETAEGLGIESGSDGDATPVGEDELEVGRGIADRWGGIGEDGDREEVGIGRGGGTMIAGGGPGWLGLVEVLPEGMELIGDN